MARTRVGAAGVAVLLAVAELATGCGPAAPPPAPYPLILLSLDTTRRDHLPFYGYEKDTAPRMAALAERGIVFDDALSVHTNTAPAHASMFTGLYPMQHGIERNGLRLRPDVPTLAEILAAHGYATGAFVSGWTLTRHTGLDRGFELYDQALGEERRRDADATLAAALPWLEARAGEERPFFLFFHLFDPHYAYAPPDEVARAFLPDGAGPFTTDPHARTPGLASDFALDAPQVAEYVARYDGEIAWADRHLGLLLDRLEALGLAERSIVVFTSDHGETLHERAWVFDHGARVTEEQVRIPLVIRLPGDAHAGVRIASPVSQVDLLPTLLEALEIPQLSSGAGRSALPLLGGESPSDRERIAFAHARVVAERVPEIRAALAPAGLVAMVRTRDAKLVEYPLHAGGGFARELFLLEEDPGETRDVAAENPALAARLHEQLEAFRRDTGARRRAPDPLPAEVEDALRELGYVED
jgi:arylsulfatase A-like enzyme